MDSNRVHGQPVNPSHDGEEAGRYLSPVGRRVQLPEGQRPLVPGKVSLQSRPQWALLQTQNVVNGVRNQTLCWTGKPFFNCLSIYLSQCLQIILIMTITMSSSFYLSFSSVNFRRSSITFIFSNLFLSRFGTMSKVSWTRIATLYVTTSWVCSSEAK
jgi:hypothetical protein